MLANPLNPSGNTHRRIFILNLIGAVDKSCIMLIRERSRAASQPVCTTTRVNQHISSRLLCIYNFWVLYQYLSIFALDGAKKRIHQNQAHLAQICCWHLGTLQSFVCIDGSYLSRGSNVPGVLLKVILSFEIWNIHLSLHVDGRLNAFDK